MLNLDPPAKGQPDNNTPPNPNPPPVPPQSIPKPVLIAGAVLCSIVAILFLIHITGLHTYTFFTPRNLLISLGFICATGAVASGIIYRNNVASDPDAVIPATVILNILVFLVGGLLVVSICTASGPCSWTASIIWSLATLAIGGAAGFLFGIPRNRTAKSLVPRRPTPSATQVPTPVTVTAPVALVIADPANPNPVPPAPPETDTPAPAPPAQPDPPSDGQGNETAIEQISDWLTKIIVGVGLTNLKEIPAQLDRLGKYVGMSIDPIHPNQYLAVGIVIYFSVLGVISGYLITQLYLHRLVNRQ